MIHAEDPRERAAAWYARLCADDATGRDRADALRWARSSPDAAAAARRVDRALALIDIAVDQAGTMSKATVSRG